MIGYAPAERGVTLEDGGEVTLDVALSTSAQQLEEVVSVGYGNQTRGELSTSVSSVDAADIAGQPVASVDAALQGRQPGSRSSRTRATPATRSPFAFAVRRR